MEAVCNLLHRVAMLDTCSHELTGYQCSVPIWMITDIIIYFIPIDTTWYDMYQAAAN